jgi:GT2 family glycosyltransferase
MLSIVVVNWNGGELFRRCIESVRRHPPSVPYEIIVVDNASTDGSLQWARDARVIANTENVGFGKANNQAFAVSRSPFVFLLNADAEVTGGALDRLMATLREHPRAAVCAPRLVNPDGSLQPSVWPNPLTPLHILVSGLGLWRLLPRGARGRLLFGDQWSYDALAEVPMAGGAALMVRREAIDAVGGFAESFAMYGEDNEWCLRMRRAGWTVLFDPRATVMHHGASFSRMRWGDDLTKLRHQTETYLRMQRMTLSPAHRLANVLALSLVAALRSPWRRDARMRLRLYLGDLTSRGARRAARAPDRR